jgi:hypothetical protein
MSFLEVLSSGCCHRVTDTRTYMGLIQIVTIVSGILARCIHWPPTTGDFPSDYSSEGYPVTFKYVLEVPSMGCWRASRQTADLQMAIGTCKLQFKLARKDTSLIASVGCG